MFPRKGAIALVTTALALILLFNFKTPDHDAAGSVASTGGSTATASSSAAPVLASEALAAQSATIDIVSGATYPSQAYAQSLQAALDQAGFASAQVSG